MEGVTEELNEIIRLFLSPIKENQKRAEDLFDEFKKELALCVDNLLSVLQESTDQDARAKCVSLLRQVQCLLAIYREKICKNVGITGPAQHVAMQ